VDLYLRIANYENFTWDLDRVLTMVIIGGWECARFCAGAIFIKLLPIALDLMRHSHRQGLLASLRKRGQFSGELSVVYLCALIILFLIAEPEGLARLLGECQALFPTVAYAY